MDNNSKEFKALQKRWYKKIERGGFEDIEQTDGNLKVWSSQQTKIRTKDNPLLQQTKEEYYRLAGHFLYDYKFETPRDQLVWEMHANGTSIRNIVLYLKSKRIKTSKCKVHKTLQKLRAEMINLHSRAQTS